MSSGISGHIEIAHAEPGDVGWMIARHIEIYIREFGYPRAFEGYVVEAFDDFLKAHDPLKDPIFIARSEGGIVGSIAVKQRSADEGQLRFLILDEAARGHGTGRRLVAEVIALARERGWSRLTLETASNLLPARALYARHGFRLTAAVPMAWLPEGVTSETWILDLG